MQAAVVVYIATSSREDGRPALAIGLSEGRFFWAWMKDFRVGCSHCVAYGMGTESAKRTPEHSHDQIGSQERDQARNGAAARTKSGPWLARHKS
jgi:hypothetical protein